MRSDGKLDVIDNQLDIDSNQEREHRLNSLHSLVCDLLKTNQELRDALLAAKSDAGRNQRP